MKCALHSPSYLVRNAHSYCFRLIVPKDLQEFVGRTELRYTLRTGYLGVAKRKSRFLAGQAQFIFQFLRKGFFGMHKLSDGKVQQLVVAYIRRSIEGLDRVFDKGQDENRPYDDPPSFFSYLEEMDTIKEDLMIKLNFGDYSMLEKSIDNFLKENGISEVDKTSPEYRKLSIEIHKAETKLIPIEQKHRQLDFSYKDQLPKLFPEAFPDNEPPPIPRVPQAPNPPEAPVPMKKQVTIGKVFKEYWIKKEPDLKPTSRPEFKRAYDHFIAFVGKGTKIDEIDKALLRKYKERLENEEYRPGKKRSKKTISDKYMTLIKGFFTYAVDYGFIEKNPVSGLIDKDKNKKRPDEERDVFSTDDLRKIFCESSEYLHDQMKHPYQFWIPLIGLYTGMRIEEVCQLYVADIKQLEGVWCFDINQDRQDKSVKNSERRKVPLHPFLIKDLNFVGFVQGLPDQNGRIFPELKRISNKYSKYATRWFSKFKKKCGVVAEPGNKAFHSFRHTVANHLYEKDVPETNVSMLVGHSLSGETGGRYIKPLRPKLLYEKTVIKLDYNIDLNHLKNSKFVVR